MRRHPSQFAEHFFASDEINKRKQEKSRQNYRFRISFGLVSLCLFMLVYVMFLLHLHWSTLATDEKAPSLTIREEQKLEKVSKEDPSERADVPNASVSTSISIEITLPDNRASNVNKKPSTDAESLMRMEEEAQGSEMEIIPSLMDTPTIAIPVVPTKVEMSEPSTVTETPLVPRHQIMDNYDDLRTFLEKYDQDRSQKKTDTVLVLLFTCDEDDEEPSEWMAVCTQATNLINQTFEKADEKYRLVMIRVGSETEWKKGTNSYKTDFDLKLKRIPSLMRWDGNGTTSMTLWEHSLLEQATLDYVFEIADNTSDASIARALEGKKKYKLTNNYTEYRAMLEQYRTRPQSAEEHLFFVLFVSGHLENNRPWCPYCRFIEVPLHIAYHAYAPSNARLLAAEVADEYKEWKRRKSPFQAQAEVRVTAVPSLYNVTRIPTMDGFQLKFERIFVRLDRLAELRPVFQNTAMKHV